MTPFRSKRLDLATWLRGQPRYGCFFTIFLVLILFWVITLPKTARADYPQIGVSGYKKWIYSDVKVEPQANYFSYVSSGEVFNRGIGGPWSEALKLNIRSQINEELGVNYQVNQFPALEDNYRVGVNYNKYSIIFGNQNLFTNQELIPADTISGATLGGEFGGLNIKYLISGNFPKAALSGPYRDRKQYISPDYFGTKSQTDYGKNDDYLELLGLELGRSDIKVESVKVSVGNKILINDFDFLFDSEYGRILLPSAFKSYQTGIVTCESLVGEKIEKTFNLESEAPRRAYYIPEFRVIDASESITVDGLKLKRGVDYRAYYNSGLFILSRPLPGDAEVQIDYDFSYGANHYITENFTGRTGINLQLSYKNLISGGEIIIKNGVTLTRGNYPSGDYLINYSNGAISFTVPLVATDIVEARYSYRGIRQTVLAISSEYKLADWHKVGISYFEISPNKTDEALFASYNPSSYTIWNISDRVDINPHTYILGEISSSAGKPDYRSSLTQESDSALKLSARTEVGRMQLFVNYKNIGPAFASIRKVKNGENWKFEEKSLHGEYKFGDYLEVRGGTGSELSRRSTATQEGTTTTTLGISLNPGFSLLSFDADIYLKRPESGEEEISQLFAFRFRPDHKSSSINYLLRDWEVVAKYYYNAIGRSRKENNYQYLSYLKSHFGLSANVGWKYAYASEDGFPSGNRFDGLLRVTYMFDFGQGHKLEIYSDYLDGLQKNSLIRGETKNIDAKIAEIGYGFLWRIPQANPILLELSFGGYYKTRSYQDSLNPADNYKASSLSIEGRFDF